MTLVAVTHDGHFHSDDVFAAAILRIAFPNVEIVRSRNARIISQANIVFDVGGIFDPEKKRFDHHQPNPPCRPDGVPFSAAGLVWRHCVEKIAARYRVSDIERLYQAIDLKLLKAIDYADNGVAFQAPDSVIAMIGDLNPAWNSSENSNEAFFRALRIASELFEAMLEKIASKREAEGRVLSALEKRNDPDILVLDRPYPWNEIVEKYDRGWPHYIVHPTSTGDYQVTCFAKPETRMTPIHPFPSVWRGLRDADLQAITGVADAIFCHNSGFCGFARSLAGALSLAERARGEWEKRKGASEHKSIIEL